MITAETTVLVPSSMGVEVAVHHFGGSGPVLLICHGGGFHAHCYAPMVTRLQADFSVWGIDLRAHGASGAPQDGSLDWSGFADDVLAAVDHIGVDTVHVFGHSMGAAAALLAELQRPGLIQAAWLYEPIVFHEDMTERNEKMAAGAVKRQAEFPSRAEAMLRYAARPPLGRMRADALAAYVTHGFHDTSAGTVTLACTPEQEAAVFMGAETMLSDVDHLTTPMVIAHGLAPAPWTPGKYAPELLRP